MSDRILDEAIVALRATRGDGGRAGETLARIQTTLEERGASNAVRRMVSAVGRSPVLRIAAAFSLALALGTTCYAAFFGAPEVLRDFFGLDATTRPRARAPRAQRGDDSRPPPDEAARAAVRAPETNSAPADVEPVHDEGRTTAVHEQVEQAPAKVAGPRTSRASKRTTHLPIAERSVLSRAAEDVPEAPAAQWERLYREAHRSHFVERDYAAALIAWDRYLGVASGAPLGVEARYNRALCLVRLGRYREAREALVAIARGEQGAYRQREARALLSRLP
jgi:hypothetical protein